MVMSLAGDGAIDPDPSGVLTIDVHQNGDAFSDFCGGPQLRIDEGGKISGKWPHRVRDRITCCTT